MSVKIIGLDAMTKNFSAFSRNMVDAITQGAQLTQAQMVNHAKANHAIDAHRQGRFVSHHGGAGLVGSIQPGPITITDTKVSAEVDARAAYASFVEEGTSKSKAYPYLAPAKKAMQKVFPQNLKRFMDRVKVKA